MGKQSKATTMEIDDPDHNQILPKFSVNVLQLLKSAQMQHGLRHGDYTRYRRYCTARLRRLYKSLKFTHGRGRYAKRTIAESTVTEARFLHLVLYSAERAWSHAMEKRQLPNGPNARQRIYLIGRLRKAVKWATLFSHLCAVKADSRTSFEAEASEVIIYAVLIPCSHCQRPGGPLQPPSCDSVVFFSEMTQFAPCIMYLLVSRQELGRGFNTLQKCQAVYEELGKYGDLDNQVLCRERVEELEPSIRYCLHKIGQSNIQASELLHIGDMEGPALDLFKAKLEAVMAEARSQQAASMTEFHWLGHRFPISNAKTRVAILKAQELEKDIHDTLADTSPADKRLVTAGSAESVKDDLNGLDKAVSTVLGERTIERNLLLVKVAKSKFAKRRDDKHEKITKPEELVRLYDLLLQNTADLSDLVSSGRDKKPEEMSFAEECACKTLAFRAERCFYVATSYGVAGKRAEAYALYCRARSLAEDALRKFKMLNGDNKSWQNIMKELEDLCNKCRSNSCIEHALGIMEENRVQENLSERVSNMSLTGADPLEKFLLDKLNVYESAVGDSNVKRATRIAVFPPAFQPISRNPIVLDLAYNNIEFPPIEHRMKDRKQKGGFISRIFG
ncbi:hypothetical protein RJT34_00621 [Clitoria ternatea]|uniref:Signal recognition particle subunit SRP68 n=1 Tax=Clitoria ternatea TaxID=43366 RepID=A0AAN9KHD2_CLITE